MNTKSYKISTTHSRILWQIHSQTYNCSSMVHLRNLTFTHPDKVRKKSLFILTLKQRLFHWQFAIILNKKKWLSNFRIFSQQLSLIHFLFCLFVCFSVENHSRSLFHWGGKKTIRTKKVKNFRRKTSYHSSCVLLRSLALESRSCFDFQSCLR